MSSMENKKIIKNLKGTRYGMLVVINIHRIEDTCNKKQTSWVCQCDCGEKVTIPHKSLLRKKPVMSCGCFLMQGCSHNMRETRIYKTYNDMLSRVLNKKHSSYHNYGGRGIKICDEWLDKENGFINFYNWAKNNGYTNELSIDRINVDGNYEPNNCRWITMKEQAKNRQQTLWVEYNGEKMTLKDFSKFSKASYGIVKRRYHNGENIESMLLPQLDYKKDQILNINGVEKTYEEWSKQSGLSCYVLRNRKNMCWDDDELLLTSGTRKKNYRAANGKGKYNTSSKSFELIDPSGIVHKGTGIKEFARTVGMPEYAFVGLMNGRYKQYKEWKKFENKGD